MSSSNNTGSDFQNGINVPVAKIFIDEVAVTASAAELNALKGITASVAELNILDNVTKTASELNNLNQAVTAGSSAATIANYKRVSVSSTTIGQVITLDVPTLGAVVDVFITAIKNSTTPHTVYSGANATFDGTNHTATITVANNLMQLTGLSSALWKVAYNASTSIVFST